jgi:hypothetical protein
VEEFLRFESPIQYTARVTKGANELCGVRIPKRQTILCMLGAANRGPKQFKDPDLLTLSRLNNQHLAFSAGPHFCIGSQLARLKRSSRHSKNYPTLPENAPRSASRMGWQLWVQGPEDITGADVIIRSLCNFGTGGTR